MIGTLSPSEQSQLLQTIEMFEIITQTQPQDYQSLEILKEAYSKLDREEDVIRTSRRIAQAYVQLGQLSSAILEYESILQRRPEDPEVQAALGQIETQANNMSGAPASAPGPEALPEPSPAAKATSATTTPAQRQEKRASQEIDDGRQTMFSAFVESKIITTGDFDLCWTPPTSGPPAKVVDPFIQTLADRGTLPIDRSMKILCEKTRLGFLLIDKYDVDMELIRSFPVDLCRRWCVLPFDRMSKSILVATANPFNRKAARDFEEAAKGRLIWYLSPPQDIIRALKKAFR